jgi:hypothetical protein
MRAHTMTKLALLLSLLALGALGLVGGGCDDDDETTAGSETETSIDRSPSSAPASASVRVEETINRARPADKTSCGTYGRWRLTVFEGDLASRGEAASWCPVARRVMHGVEYNRLPGSWICSGPDGDIHCSKELGASSRIVFTARF